MKQLRLISHRGSIASYIITIMATLVVTATYIHLSPCVTITFLNDNIEQKTTRMNYCPPINKDSCVTLTYFKDLTIQLTAAVQQLHIAQNEQKPPSNSTMKALRRVLMLMNPHSMRNVRLNRGNASDKTPEVCTDVFINRTFGVPYYENEKGWVTIPCDAPPIEKIVSIVVNILMHRNCSQYMDWILKGITKTYPEISVYVATNPKCEASVSTVYPNVQQVSMPSAETAGNVWMKLLSSVSTPYVLIARDIFHFTNFSRLERQISMISNNDDVSVAGGATRNLTGHWSVGCFQTKMSNYILEYVEGYHVSRNECMFCDYLTGPFVARTEIFKEIPLNASLSGDMIFHDFFQELKIAGYLTANCPDSMYFANNKRPEYLARESWILLSRKWELSRILLPKGKKHSITCEESELKCKRSISKGFLIPLCCREKYLGLLKTFLDTGIPYEFRDGDVLAAVKMRGSIPWDTDTDLNVRTTYNDHWKKVKEQLKRIKYKSIDVGEWLAIPVRDTNINVDPIPELSYIVLLPEELKIPTLVEYDGSWLVGPVSPGLYARNGYGVEILKHVQSYSIYGHSDPYEAYSPGVFLPCPKPTHHACLDHFSTDGNIQFLAP